MKRKQRNTGIVLHTKRDFHSTCLGPYFFGHAIFKINDARHAIQQRVQNAIRRCSKKMVDEIDVPTCKNADQVG